MKAVIMAGGEGTRLRPVTLGLPKPMVPVFDKPVMEHMINLLKRHGITEICVTLQYMPEVVQAWFGDGADLGVSLTYFVEREPLGTAGSVKNCMSALGEDDFLVISGDAVCDLDLSAAVGFHRASRAEATLLLYRHPKPLEYGLVLTGDTGRVEQFIEKPGWSQVFANTVNTGIYVLTRRAMERVPEGQAYDFGRDLFPAMLAQGAPLYGHVAEGYWCDMGDCDAYLACTADALSGKAAVDMGLPQRAFGVWSAQELPDGVNFVPPCWIGEGVTIGKGSLIGPHAVLGRGVTVGERSMVQRSVLMGYAAVGSRCTLYGAVLCRSARAATGAVLNEGAVLGAESVAAENSVLLERVKLWPGRKCAPGARLATSLMGGGDATGAVSFGDGGVIRGSMEGELSPELLLTIGGALGAEGKVGLGHGGGSCARLLARCAGCGAAAAGAEVLVQDGGCAAAAAWTAARYSLPISLFVEQRANRIFLHFFDQDGLPLDRSRQRKLEGALLRGEVRRAESGQVGDWVRVGAVGTSMAADAARRAGLAHPVMTPVAVAVPGDEPADRILATALEDLGCVVIRKWANGVPGFAAEYGGLRLTAWDEEGAVIPPEQVLAIISLIEFEQGGKRVALPTGAPQVVKRLAHERGGQVLELERDGDEARQLYVALPWLRDAVFAAARICARLGRSGERLGTLAGRHPQFAVVRREVPLQGGRGDVMQALAAQIGAEGSREGGVRVQQDESVVWLAPMSRRASLRVAVEAADVETAQELCDVYEKAVRMADQAAQVAQEQSDK